MIFFVKGRNMAKKLTISKMQKSDIVQAVEIWVAQYERYCSSEASFPNYWRKNTEEIKGFLNRKVQDGAAIVAKSGNKLIGYLAYDEFPFNGEKSVFCPAIAHAVLDEFKEEGYLSLYKNISGEWINRNVFNHMWTINYNDTALRNILFELGFGSYVIDAFANTNNNVIGNPACNISKAEIKDTDALYDLVEESREYYCSAPLFLKRDQYTKEDIQQIIQNNNVFIAWENKIAIGFIHVSVSQRVNIIDLSVNNSGLIDEIGAYIKLDYREKGIGKGLLEKVFDSCKKDEVQTIHLDFETANLYANKFWRKHFKPMLLSVRRTINKNIND